MVSDFLHAIYHNQCYSFKFSIFPSNTVWTIESDAISLSALQGSSYSLELGAQLLCNALKFPQLGACPICSELGTLHSRAPSYRLSGRACTDLVQLDALLLCSAPRSFSSVDTLKQKYFQNRERLRSNHPAKFAEI